MKLIEFFSNIRSVFNSVEEDVSNFDVVVVDNLGYRHPVTGLLLDQTGRKIYIKCENG
jgi:hypothetical protein